MEIDVKIPEIAQMREEIAEMKYILSQFISAQKPPKNKIVLEFEPEDKIKKSLVAKILKISIQEVDELINKGLLESDGWKQVKVKDVLRIKESR